MSELVRAPVGWPAPAHGWPPWLWLIPFDGSRHPDAEHPSPIEDGGNCQRYAYELLARFGCRIDDLHSSELWADTGSTSRVGATHLAPLDLVLFNAGADPYGAHVGVVMAHRPGPPPVPGGRPPDRLVPRPICGPTSLRHGARRQAAHPVPLTPPRARE